MTGTALSTDQQIGNGKELKLTSEKANPFADGLRQFHLALDSYVSALSAPRSQENDAYTKGQRLLQSLSKFKEYTSLEGSNYLSALERVNPSAPVYQALFDGFSGAIESLKASDPAAAAILLLRATKIGFKELPKENIPPKQADSKSNQDPNKSQNQKKEDSGGVSSAAEAPTTTAASGVAAAGAAAASDSKSEKPAAGAVDSPKVDKDNTNDSKDNKDLNVKASTDKKLDSQGGKKLPPEEKKKPDSDSTESRDTDPVVLSDSLKKYVFSNVGKAVELMAEKNLAGATKEIVTLLLSPQIKNSGWEEVYQNLLLSFIERGLNENTPKSLNSVAMEFRRLKEGLGEKSQFVGMLKDRIGDKTQLLPAEDIAPSVTKQVMSQNLPPVN